MTDGTLYHVSAFSRVPEGGNPAGVWIGDRLPEPAEMQRIAKEVGFSETAFIMPRTGSRRTVRYYSPEMEVPFCGHATIASGVKIGQLNGEGEYHFETLAGDIAVRVRERDGVAEASLTSVPPRHRPVPKDLLDRALALLGWKDEEVDRSIPPALAFAGGWHLVIAAASLDRLARLDYDFEALKAVMREAELTTLQLIWREGPDRFHARDPFPVGGIVEDPATGAAAAALGGYLRDAGLLAAPTTITIRQGEAMGRPSLITVEIPGSGGIVVTGNAVDMDRTPRGG